jgi:hypothetical protein
MYLSDFAADGVGVDHKCSAAHGYVIAADLAVIFPVCDNPRLIIKPITAA